MTWLKNIKTKFPQGSPIKLDPPVDPFMEEFNRYQTAGQDGSNPDGTEKSSMMQGQALDEVVVVGAKPKKTRTEHRLDKTKKKLETSTNTVGGGERSNRLRKRAERLENKAIRQEGKNKKKYVRKDKKFWKDNSNK